MSRVLAGNLPALVGPAVTSRAPRGNQGPGGEFPEQGTPRRPLVHPPAVSRGGGGNHGFWETVTIAGPVRTWIQA
jgi:hypothetical protein